MALKEIKERIRSIRSTRKITSAMKMVSSAKLHKAQHAIENMLPYSASLHHVMNSLLSGEYANSLCDDREVKRVAIVAFSSDGSLCGAFNTNIIRATLKTIEEYDRLSAEDIRLYTVGRKVFDAIRESGYIVEKNFEGLAEKPDYTTIAEFADSLIREFEAKRLDRVELIYYHFESAGKQMLKRETILPLVLPKPQEEKTWSVAEYIVEPSREALLRVLIPKSVKLKLYTALLDSSASEHAVRMISMQAATENADNLISTLTVEYNKSRQQAITNELLDIIGGAFGQ